ncbi:MAG: ThuA domain-containing protein, partial [Planctomycetes bacterium]|nr:ThuA domain-containing protein [Planctomycetota bacterium]
MHKVAFCTVLMGAIGFMPGHSPTAIAQSSEIANRIDEAVPSKPYAQPAQPRKMLVFTLTRGYRHESIAAGVHAFRILGEKTGAFEIVHSEDPAVFEPQRLIQFDAVCMLNTTGELFTPSNFEELEPAARSNAGRLARRWKQSLLDFVAGGGGLIGIHAAADCFYKWSEYGDLMGGYFNGHPWHEEVTVIVEEPDHPLCAPFGATSFQITDEIYQIRSPYSRLRQRVLLSLDADRTDLRRSGIRRTDRDFAVSWVRTYGAGRVFYCSLGHREEIYWNPAVLRHYLAGIQFAMGDLVADATPSIRRPGGGEALFDGQTLAGWQGVVSNVKARTDMSDEQLAAAQEVANKQMAEHWTVTDGVIRFDGEGESIATIDDFGDIELRVD